MQKKVLSLCAAFLAAHLAARAAPSARAIRRSDVVFMYDNPKHYKTYGCTVLGWAGSSNPARIAAAHTAGLRLYASHVGFRTEFRRVIDFSSDFMEGVCRDLSGKPLTVPWLWDHKYKGQPAWHWCTNSPFYRRYLQERLKQIARGNPDGLHIDDYTGTAGPVVWGAGCFCEYCMKGFSSYLKENLQESELHKTGITDVDRFRYDEYLRARGETPQTYRKNRFRVPLYRAFVNWQVKEATRFVAEYHKRLCRLCGRRVTLSVNSSLNRPETLAIAPYVSYFCCEVYHEARKKTPPRHPIAIYKLGDALSCPVASTASGQDWSFVKEQKLEGLVRTWITLSYAFGHTFMAPHRQWCYDPKQGTHWYDGPTGEYAFVYRFVRRNASLLDGYEAVATVAVLYDNAARRRGKGNIEPLCVELAEKNVPFTVVVSGDDWLPIALNAQKLASFRAVIVPDDLPQRKENAPLKEIAGAGKLIRWPKEKEKLAALYGRFVQVRGSGDIMVVPRKSRRDPASPCVLHLLNRDYDAQKDGMRARGSFTVSFSKDLFGRKLSEARLVSLRDSPRKVSLVDRGRRWEIRIRSLAHWGIVSLK